MGTLETETKHKITYALTELIQQATQRDCYLEFDVIDCSMPGDGVYSRGSLEQDAPGNVFVTRFVPYPEPTYEDGVIEFCMEDVNWFDKTETDDETNNLYDEYQLTDEDVTELDNAIALLESDTKENNKLLNNWAVVKHDYNDDFTVTWEADGTQIKVAQEDLNKFEELHGFDAKEAIDDLVVEINKDAQIAAFDKAKIDPETL